MNVGFNDGSHRTVLTRTLELGERVCTFYAGKHVPSIIKLSVNAAYEMSWGRNPQRSILLRAAHALFV